MYRPVDLCLAVSLGFLSVLPAAGDDAARYLAVFSDGSHVEGETVTGWHEHPGDPKLDETTLANPGRPLRWLRDRRLAAYRPRVLGPGYVELVGGDRIPGHVVAYQEGEFHTLEAHWPYYVVQTSVPIHLPGRPERRQIRVLANALQRIVMRPQQGRRFQPGTVFARDGRQLVFQRFQWGDSSVRLLLRNDVQELPPEEIDEIHLPVPDQWTTYYAELAALSGDLSGELIRLETTHGFLVTGSTERFHAAVVSDTNSPEHWYHMVQPAWSLDPIWMHFPTIRTRWHFRPHEVPLSRIAPDRVEQRSLLAHGHPWQTDRNVRGGTLLAGDRLYGWGFGVHATNELWFRLPSAVRAFQSRVGLDRLAGDGGCARAMVFANAPKGKPLFASPPLVGSSEVHATGELALAGPKAGQDTLILMADAFHRGRPKGADPLDIRDTVDWLEPLLRLDPATLRTELNGRIPDLVPAWHGWTMTVEGNGSLRHRSLWDLGQSPEPRWAMTVGTGNPRLILTTDRRITADQHWLLVRLKQLAPEAKPGQLEIRRGETVVARFAVPSCGWAPPVCVPLAESQQRDAKLEVVYSPHDAKEQIEWLALTPIDWTGPVRWVALKPDRVEASSGATLTPQADDSILASGTLAEREIYRVIAKTDVERITAVRLEVLPDDSLPGSGPGRAPEGSFVLTRFRMGTVPPVDEKFEGRYVRIELPGEGRTLSLAEVEVFAGETNIAKGHKATQSSVDWEGVPERAVDGDTTGDWEHGSVTHTAEEAANPWWEVDLGAVHKIDRVVVWNRTDYSDWGLHLRLANFRLVVLDDKRQPVFRRVVFDAPRPNTQIDQSLDMEVHLRNAGDRFSRPADAATAPPGPRWPAHQVWAMAPTAEGSDAAMFVLDEPMEVGDRELSFRLEQLGGVPRQNLGRFRLWITSDPPPLPPEPE